jgi:catechol 2,3-dioxygenase
VPALHKRTIRELRRVQGPLMHEVPRMSFAHMGIYVSNIELMLDFYSRVLGFSVTDRARVRDADVVFLSRNPEEHHQIVLVPGRDISHPSTIN